LYLLFPPYDFNRSLEKALTVLGWYLLPKTRACFQFCVQWMSNHGQNGRPQKIVLCGVKYLLIEKISNEPPSSANPDYWSPA
jgi:hypothetical protein